MKRTRAAALIAAVAAALALAGPARNDAGVPPAIATEKIGLTYLPASRVADRLVNGAGEDAGESPDPGALPAGIECIAPDDPEKTLLVRGSAGAVAAVKEMARRLDVRPPSVRLEIRLVRYQFRADGSYTSAAVCAVPAGGFPNTMLPVALRDGARRFTADIRPRINDEESITCAVTLREIGENRRVRGEAKMTRRLPSGEKRFVTGLTDSEYERLREFVARGVPPERVGQGDIPSLGLASTAHYLEITATVQKTGPTPSGAGQ